MAEEIYTYMYINVKRHVRIKRTHAVTSGVGGMGWNGPARTLQKIRRLRDGCGCESVTSQIVVVWSCRHKRHLL